jgi:hypothetical protein
VKKILIGFAVAVVCAVSPALADSITSINGTAVTSTNEGSVTSVGTFGHTSINGGKGNFIGVTSTGAAATVLILKDGVDPNATNDSIGVSSVTATNKSTGTVTATGTFNGGNVLSTNSNSSGNSVGVSAAGTSVSISIVHK